MSPWLVILPLLVVIFFFIMAFFAVRDTYIWYRDGREFSDLQKQAKEQRQQRKLEKQSMPTLKERPPEPPKSGIHTIKPPERPGH